MKIKSFNNFINESIVYQDYIWKLNENDIKEYFYDLSDVGYLINIDFGFYKEDSGYYKNNPLEGTNIPCYLITIISTSSFNDSSSKAKSENLTDSVLFAIDIMNNYANTIETLTREIEKIEELELDLLKIENGIYYGNIKLNSISLCFICEDSVEINQIQLASIYGWEDAIIKDDSIWAKVDIIDLVDMLISNKAYKNLLKNWEDVYDNFDITDYQPDINSMLLDLDDSNIVLLIKALIKKFGIKEFKFDNEDDCLNYYTNRSNFYELVDLIKELKEIETSDNNPIICIIDIISNYKMDAHIYENNKDLIKEFDRIVKKEFTFYKETVMEDEEVTYYYLKFDNGWLGINYYNDDVDFNTIDDALNNYFNNNYFNYELNPNWSDYGDYDLKQLNKEIKSELTYFLK